MHVLRTCVWFSSVQFSSCAVNNPYFITSDFLCHERGLCDSTQRWERVLRYFQWRFHVGPGGGHRPLQIVAGPPKFSCTDCDQLILRKIRKFDATEYQILRSKCTKFDFRWGFAPRPTGGAYSALPGPLTVFKGACF